MRNKKNFFRTMLVLAMAMIMTMAMGMTALAAGSNKLTITPNDSTKEHSYQAYQIFAGDKVGEKLTNITWGTAITDNGATLLTKLAAVSFADTEVVFTTSMTAENAAKMMEKLATATTSESDKAKLASAIADALGSTAGVAKSGTGSVEYTGLEDGFYFVKETTAATSIDSLSRYMFTLVGDTSITAKAVVPEVSKKIIEGTSKVDANTASIGSKVSYVVEGSVPDTTGYNKYFYILSDTLSAGLTYNDDITVCLYDVATDSETLVDSAKYAVSTSNVSGKTAVEVAMKDFIANFGNDAGKKIRVYYSATVNNSADMTTTGNPNEVQLTYSNDPNVNYNGDPEKPGYPGSGEVTGKTPISKVVTYTTKIDILKVDGADHNTKLAGAKFTLTGTSFEQVKEDSTYYKKDNNAGTYYLLKDGTYTETAPTTETTEKYVSTTDKYSLVTDSTVQGNMIPVDTYGVTGSDGKLSFAGLGEGTYYLTEIEAPTGYSKLVAPIVVTISADLSGTEVSWTVTQNGNAVTDNIVVENNNGITLPSTGGIGTTIFYVVGGILVLGAAVLLVTRKRMSSEEK